MTDWAALGRQAYADGEPAAAALNPYVVAALEGLPVGSPEGTAILYGFRDGWFAAALEATAPPLSDTA